MGKKVNFTEGFKKKLQYFCKNIANFIKKIAGKHANMSHKKKKTHFIKTSLKKLNKKKEFHQIYQKNPANFVK